MAQMTKGTAYLFINQVFPDLERGYPNQSITVGFGNGDTVTLTAEKIRIATDPKFAARIQKMAKEQAEHIGNRVRHLREERHLSREEVERRDLTLPKGALQEIEEGRLFVLEELDRTPILQQVLAVLGCTVADLAIPLSPSLVG